MEKYEFIKHLGAGGNGSVELYRRKSDGKLVAIKKPLKDRQITEEEINFMKTLKHPYILQLIEAIKHNGQTYIVMEYADKGTAWDYLMECYNNEIYAPEYDVMKIFTQVCLAFKYIHERKIKFRDLSPDNVFLFKSGEAKVGDFGCALQCDTSSEKHGDFEGKYQYAPPEFKSYDLRSDIWVLGCFLYMMCEMNYIHTFDSNLSPYDNAIIAHQKEKHEISDKFSEGLQNLYDFMMIKDAKERPRITDVLNYDHIKNWVLGKDKTFQNIGVLKGNEDRFLLYNYLFEMQNNIDKTLFRDIQLSLSNFYYGYQNMSSKCQELKAKNDQFEANPDPVTMAKMFNLNSFESVYSHLKICLLNGNTNFIKAACNLKIIQYTNDDGKTILKKSYDDNDLRLFNGIIECGLGENSSKLDVLFEFLTSNGLDEECAIEICNNQRIV